MDSCENARDEGRSLRRLGVQDRLRDAKRNVCAIDVRNLNPAATKSLKRGSSLETGGNGDMYRGAPYVSQQRALKEAMHCWISRLIRRPRLGPTAKWSHERAGEGQAKRATNSI